MSSMLIALAHAWDHALTTGIASPSLVESLGVEGMAEIVMAMASDEAPQAGPRAVMCAAASWGNSRAPPWSSMRSPGPARTPSGT
ncbi:hypothetical protein SJ20_05800 [Micrococcus sp. MS-ASIII-49]|uniref:hypothetical protein n=1 Tax=Micrococcus sp. MS-ASIII-49 TaxID=1593237 RepID=UPI0010140820|nr:hypothetical protein [Micrococcus sp. MS-ASIII-49]RYD00127.1 hypothetical protein SJ20_05800 [Micrococcus sp. MS-ASIII-49]